LKDYNRSAAIHRLVCRLSSTKHIRDLPSACFIHHHLGRDRPIRLRFEVDAGIRGDLTGDWMGIAPGGEPGCLFAAQ